MTLLVAAILAGVGLEAAALLVWHRRTGRGPAPAALLPNLVAGACLLGAVLAALMQAIPLLLACLLGGLVAHVMDLRSRWG